MHHSNAKRNTSQTTIMRPMILLMAIFAACLGVAGATENGGSVWPVGAESFATAAGVPHKGQTLFYEYTLFYTANELDDAKGHKSNVPPDFKLRVFAVAGKLSHNWGVKFLGGELGSYIAVPTVYEQLRVTNTEKFSKDDFTNIDVVPLTLFNHRGIVHWYYELQFETLGTGYVKGQPINIGQHNVAFTPAAAITLTPHKGAQNIMSRVDYVINDQDHATHYHSGNEFFWQYDAQQEIPHHKASLGVSGYFYQQVTNDKLSGVAVVKPNADSTTSVGYKGRVLEFGPEATFPLGKHGAIVVKWNHDFLVQNKPRGNAFWFQVGIPFSYLHHASGKQ